MKVLRIIIETDIFVLKHNKLSGNETITEQIEAVRFRII